LTLWKVSIRSMSGFQGFEKIDQTVDTFVKRRSGWEIGSIEPAVRTYSARVEEAL